MSITLIVNANIWGSEYDSLIIKDDVILRLGKEERLRRLFKGKVKIFDAGGRMLIPGLADAHLHLVSYAINKGRLDLRGVSSIEELKELLRRRRLGEKSGKWIVGWGWDQERFTEKRYPTKDDLDDALPDSPVILVRVCGHVAVANTLALKILRLSSRDGLLYEDDVYKALNSIPLPSFEEMTNAVKEAIKEAYSYGLTELHLMSVETWELGIYKRVLNTVPIRLKLFMREPPTTYSEERLIDITGVKVFMDGSFGGRTAALREPYSDDPNNKGKLLMDYKKLLELIKDVNRRGLKVAIHTIGDRALEEALKAIKELSPGNSGIRLEHASLVPPDLLEELATFKPGISVQPHFIISDSWIVERLGRRAKWVYSYKSLIESGLLIAGSSDAPVEPLNPWYGVYAAVDRGEKEGLRIWHVTAEQRMGFNDALRLYINGKIMEGTYLSERIRPGMPADLALLNVSEEPRSVKEIKNIKSVLTIINGEVVYNRLASGEETVL